MIERRKLAGELKASREKWASPEARVSPSKVGKISGVSEPERLQFRFTSHLDISRIIAEYVCDIAKLFTIWEEELHIVSQRIFAGKKEECPKERTATGAAGICSTSATRRSSARAENVRHGYYMAEKDNTKVCDAAEEGRTVEERFDVDSPHRPGSRDSPVDVDMSIFRA